MHNLEDQYTLSDFPAFQPLVAHFIHQQKAMDIKTMPLQTLLATLSFQENDTQLPQRKKQTQHRSNPLSDSEETHQEGRKATTKKKQISKRHDQHRKPKDK